MRNFQSVQELAQVSNSSISLANISSGRAYIAPEGHQNISVALSDEDRHEISQMLGGWHSTRAAVYNGLRYLDHLPGWIKDRIIYSNISNRWGYCAGQDYTAETALIRRKIAG